MSSPSAQVIFVPVLFVCEADGKRTYATQYIAVPAYSTIDDVRAAANAVLSQMLSGVRTQFAQTLQAGSGTPPICGFEVLPIAALPR